LAAYALEPVQSENDWRIYHEIRRKALFEDRGRPGIYDENHPDEHKTENTPLILTADDNPVGTVRLDLRNATDVIVRLVAITAKERGKGHGKNLVKLAADFAQMRGRKRLVLNSAPEATEFYRKLGFEDHVWDEAELEAHAPVVQMIKEIVEL